VANKGQGGTAYGTMASTFLEKYSLGKRSLRIKLMCFVKTVREVVRFEVQDLTSGVLLCQLL
jgi:hypothetical protein